MGRPGTGVTCAQSPALCTVCCHGHSLLGQDHGCLNAQGVRQCPWAARGNPQWCAVLCSQSTTPPVLTSLGSDLPSLGTDLGASGVQRPLPHSTAQAAVSCSAWPRPRGICPLCPQPHLTAAAPLRNGLMQRLRAPSPSQTRVAQTQLGILGHRCPFSCPLRSRGLRGKGAEPGWMTAMGPPAVPTGRAQPWVGRASLEFGQDGAPEPGMGAWQGR